MSSLAMNSIKAVCDQFLISEAYTWYGNPNEVSISPPQLNNTIAFSVRPEDSFDQRLHRHDDIHYANRQRVEVYPNRPTLVNLELVSSSLQRGPQKRTVPPASFRGAIWSLEATEQPPDEAFAHYAELEPGDGFIMLSSRYHGGSANTTADEGRLLFSCFMTRGYLRQEENQYICVPVDIAKELPLRLQKLIGYAVSEVGISFICRKTSIHQITWSGICQ